MSDVLNWSDAPDWANFLVRLVGGVWWWVDVPPIVDSRHGHHIFFGKVAMAVGIDSSMVDGVYARPVKVMSESGDSV